MGKWKAIHVFVLAVIMSAQALSGSDNKQKRVVRVENTEQLYEAVNNPLNMNREIRLSPNMYELTSFAIYGSHGIAGVFVGYRNRAEITIKKGESDEMPNAFRAIDARPADGPTVAPADRNRAVVVSSNLEFVYTEP